MFDGKEYVYAVYEEKSFSKAAQKLYITQPALSTAIKKVEKKIGTPIFDRSTSPIGLTPGGEVYIDAIEKLTEQEIAAGRMIARGEDAPGVVYKGTLGL